MTTVAIVVLLVTIEVLYGTARSRGAMETWSPGSSRRVGGL